jgi:hypothetical protein
MNVTPEPRDDAADSGRSAPEAASAPRQHRALCQLGLPLGPCADAWRRDIGTVALAIEMPAGGALPHGALLRLLLLHVFSTALASGSAAVEIGESAAVLAGRMGLPGGEQWGRLAAARLTLALDGGAAQGVFDARGRPRAGGEWRASVRLTARFLASLAEGAVTLDRRVVAALADQPLALDAYMWLASGLANAPEQGLAGASWEDLYGRFGDQGQTPETFRAAFEACLCEVTVACPAMVVIMGEHEVQVRAASPARAAAPPAAPRPAPPASEPPGEPAAAPIAEPPAAAPPIAGPFVEPEPREPAVRQGGRQAAQGISLKSHVTGLAQVVWLQRADGRDNQVVEVTPGGRYDPDSVTVLALEPLVVQISGGLYEREFERVSAWVMSNRDLIDDVWDGKIASYDEAVSRVKRVPAPGWR